MDIGYSYLCLFVTKPIKMILEEVNFSPEEELEIILIKRFDGEYHIKGWHAYINQWAQEVGKFLKTRSDPENVVDRLAVAVEKGGQRVGQSKQKKSKYFCKNYILFLMCEQWKYMSSWSSRQKDKLR